jgi:Glycerate kinase family
MRYLVAPDKFKGTMAALEVAEAIASGLRDGDPTAEVDLLYSLTLISASHRLNTCGAFSKFSTDHAGALGAQEVVCAKGRA